MRAWSPARLLRAPGELLAGCHQAFAEQVEAAPGEARLCVKEVEADSPDAVVLRRLHEDEVARGQHNTSPSAAFCPNFKTLPWVTIASRASSQIFCYHGAMHRPSFLNSAGSYSEARISAQEISSPIAFAFSAILSCSMQE